MSGVMKISWLAIVMLVMVIPHSSRAMPNATNRVAPDGMTAYLAGDYLKAAELFQKSVQAQPSTGAWLNLGLAEWQRNLAGPAVLAWERALWVDPYNAEARGNLQFARKTAQLESPEYAWHEAASMWLPVNAWPILAGVSLWFAVAMITLPRVLRWQRGNWQQGLAATGCAIFLLCLPSLYGVHTRTKIGIVQQKDTELRLTPTREGQTVMQMPAGQPVRWERQRGEYFFVRTRYGKGWVERSKLGLVCPN